MTDKPIIYYKKDCFNEPYCSLAKVIEQLYYYKQALTEIKEYCTDIKKDHYWGMRIMRFANEILQKISDCEVEDAR